jgi:hypothetical protein
MIKLALALVAVATAASAGGTPATRLSIDVWPKGRTVATGHHHYVLRCAPAVGTVPRPGNACTVLVRLAHPFAATPRGTVCPMLVLGPQEAHVVGTVRGVRVNAWLDLVHCGIDRWNRVKAIVPEPKLAVRAPPPVRPPGGTTTVTAPDGPPPALISLSPVSGPIGTVVTITGTNLAEVVGVQLGTVLTAPASTSDTQVVFTVPPGAATGTVKVFSRNGSATTVGTFTVTG